MAKCIYCGNDTCSYSFVKEKDGYYPVCGECKRKKYSESVDARLPSVTNPRDFRSWTKEDMSEAFWLHLGRYARHPNRYSLSVIGMAFRWACHDDHGLSNSFANAMRWCGIDLFTEESRTDLQEK